MAGGPRRRAQSRSLRSRRPRRGEGVDGARTHVRLEGNSTIPPAPLRRMVVLPALLRALRKRRPPSGRRVCLGRGWRPLLPCLAALAPYKFSLSGALFPSSAPHPRAARAGCGTEEGRSQSAPRRLSPRARPLAPRLPSPRTNDGWRGKCWYFLLSRGEQIGAAACPPVLFVLHLSAAAVAHALSRSPVPPLSCPAPAPSPFLTCLSRET
jgi:hypothetical protein